MSAEVLCRSLLVATGHDPGGDQGFGDAEPLHRALATAFPGLFEVEYNATLQQAIFLTNNGCSTACSSRVTRTSPPGC